VTQNTSQPHQFFKHNLDRYIHVIWTRKQSTITQTWQHHRIHHIPSHYRQTIRSNPNATVPKTTTPNSLRYTTNFRSTIHHKSNKNSAVKLKFSFSSPNLKFPRLKLEVEGFLWSPRADRTTTSFFPLYFILNSLSTLNHCYSRAFNWLFLSPLATHFCLVFTTLSYSAHN